MANKITQDIRDGGVASKSLFIAHYRESDKATQALATHLCNVAELANKFAGKVRLNKQGELIGLLHDLGKFSTAFQTYIQSAVGLLNQDEDERIR